MVVRPPPARSRVAHTHTCIFYSTLYMPHAHGRGPHAISQTTDCHHDVSAQCSESNPSECSSCAATPTRPTRAASPGQSPVVIYSSRHQHCRTLSSPPGQYSSSVQVCGFISWSRSPILNSASSPPVSKRHSRPPTRHSHRSLP